MSEITVHNHKMIFGWEEDNGLGERLIQQILRGRNGYLCTQRRIFRGRIAANIRAGRKNCHRL